MVNKNFTIVRGNSLEFRVNFIDAETLPDSINFVLKDKSSDLDAIFTLNLDDGITQDGSSYDFYISGTKTQNLQLLNYIYQINITYGVDVLTIVEGKLIVTPEV